MHTLSLQIGLTFAVAFVATAATVPLMKRVAALTGAVAHPSTERWHRGEIPLLGGGAIICGLLAPAAIRSDIPLWLMVAVLAMFSAGLIDDYVSLSPAQKLVIQIVIVTWMLSHVPGSFGPQYRAIELAIEVLWAVGLVNAVNLLDHLDGLAAGVVMIESAAAAVILAMHGAAAMAGVGAATAAAAAGFLIYNRSPASIFMGDAGALALGLMLSLLTLEASRCSIDSPFGQLAAPILLALVPVMDTAIVSVTRLATGHRISRGGRDHSSHRLVRLGLSDRRAAMGLYVLAAVAAGFAIELSRWPGPILNMTMPSLLLGFVLGGM